MKLADFYARMAPFLEGRIDHAEAVSRLYEAADQERPDARRLAIYGRFCRIHRFQVLEGVYAHCQQVIEARQGRATWEALVEAYFAVHPMKHFELNENGAAFPGFVVLESARLGWPGWLGELADFEWWEWQSKIAPEPEDALPSGAGELRLGSLVELRAYGYDLCGWLDEGEGPAAGEPPAGPSHVLFWRDRNLDGRREPATALELLLLKWVFEGQPVGLGELAAGLEPAVGEEKLGELWRAGILEGPAAPGWVQSPTARS